jgi:hypothetical protein
MKEIIKATIRERVSTAAWGALAALLMLVGKALADALPSGWFATLPSRPLLLLLALSVSLNLLTTVAIYLLLREERLTLGDGVYWDTAMNPRCPACKTPIQATRLHPEKNETIFFCVKCKQHVRATGIHAPPKSRDV